MNVQLTNDMSQLKTTVAQLQQDHHAISSNIRNSAQKTNGKIEKLTEQQKNHFETLRFQEKQINEFLQKEIQSLRDEQQKEWRSQNDFNQRLEEAIQKPKGTWERFLFLFRK
jgi:seryl-tRNA synthetase